jgi:serine/threonine protein kinase
MAEKTAPRASETISTRPLESSIPPDLPDNPAFTYSPDSVSLAASLPPERTTRPPRIASLTLARWDATRTVARPIAEAETLPRRQGMGDGASVEETAPAFPAGKSDASAENEAAPSAPSYELLRLIGRGGCGEVWEARQGSLRRLVAVKRVRADIVATASESARAVAEADFYREALAAARLDHPNIAPVHDLGADANGSPLLAMKLVRGQPWDETLKRDFPEMSPQDFLAKHLPTLIASAEALAFAHSRGIVHRDFKPAQVMTGEFGETLLMDWGLAIRFALNESAEHLQDIEAVRFIPSPDTATGPAGTPALMAPEQTSSDARGVGPWTDVYLLGGTLYFLLTGTYPHQAATAAATFYRAMEGMAEPPAERVPGRFIPSDLAALAMKALAKDPQERVPSAKAFAESVRDYLSGSSRRRESRSAAKAALRELLNARGYDHFAGCLAQLERAKALWSENPDLPSMFRSARAAYGRAALDAGDLALARLQAQALEEGEERASLLAEVQKAERHRLRKERQRWMALAIAAFLGLAVAAGSVFFIYTLAEQRDEARQARDEAKAARDAAVSARNDAQGLATYLVGDLREKLEPLGRLQLLAEAAERSLHYFENLPAVERTPEIEAARAEALLTLGSARFERGEDVEALQLAEETGNILRPLVASHPDSPKEWVRNFAFSRVLTAKIHRENGQLEKARAAFSEIPRMTASFFMSRGETSLHPSQLAPLGSLEDSGALPEDVLAQNFGAISQMQTLVVERLGLAPEDLLLGLEVSGALMAEQGRYDMALRFLGRGEEMGEAALSQSGETPKTLSRYAAVTLAKADAMLRGRLAGMSDALDKAERMIRRARELNPDDPRHAVLLSQCLALRSEWLHSRGEGQAAREALVQAFDLVRQAAQRDPDNFRWLKALRSLALRIAATPADPAAAQTIHAALRLAEQSLALKPGDLERQAIVDELSRRARELGPPPPPR